MVTALKIALVAVLLPSTQDEPKVEGLAGRLVVIQGVPEDADMVQRGEVAVGDKIQLTLVLGFFGPGSAPTSVTGRSDDSSVVAYEEARLVQTPDQAPGGTQYAGYFVAKEPGEATITFLAKGDNGGSITCGVTVVE